MRATHDKEQEARAMLAERMMEGTALRVSATRFPCSQLWGCFRAHVASQPCLPFGSTLKPLLKHLAALPQSAASHR